MTHLSSDGVPFILLAIFFLYGAGLALWERDWPELAIRGTIALMLGTFTLLGYANELRLIHEPTVRILFWCGLLTFSILLAALRFWKWAENLRGDDRPLAGATGLAVDLWRAKVRHYWPLIKQIITQTERPEGGAVLRRACGPRAPHQPQGPPEIKYQHDGHCIL